MHSHADHLYFRLKLNLPTRWAFFNPFTATNEPSKRPLYTLPNPPLPRMSLLLKASVLTSSSRGENLLSCPRCTSGSSSAASRCKEVKFHPVNLFNQYSTHSDGFAHQVRQTKIHVVSFDVTMQMQLREQQITVQHLQVAGTPAAIAPMALLPPAIRYRGKVECQCIYLDVSQKPEHTFR